MVATHTNEATTTDPLDSIPDSSALFTVEEHWSGHLHWIRYRATAPRPGAQTLVLVHGAGHNEAVWTLGEHPSVSLFTELGHDVIIVSLSGHRPSKGLVTLQTLGRYVRDAHTPVEALGLADEDVVYVGHSLGGIVVECLLERYPRTAGVVVVDCVAFHHAFDNYVPFLRSFFPHHKLTTLKALFNSAALFETDDLVRELLLGPNASDDLVRELRPHLGRETVLFTIAMVVAKFRGKRRVPGQKILFVLAGRSGFCSSSVGEASAREYGARAVVVDGPHNLMMVPGSALLAAQAIEAFVAGLPAPGEA